MDIHCKNKYERGLNQLFDDYLKECEFSSGLRPATIRGYKAVFLLFLSLIPEASDIQSLTPGILLEFFKRLQTRQRKVGRSSYRIGVRNSTIKTYWTKLNSFFEWLKKNQYIEKNPLRQIKKPPEPLYEDSKAL